jgi:hypothetical protein
MKDVPGLTPTKPLFPAIMQQTNDAGTIALSAKLDFWFRTVFLEIVMMLGFKRPEQAAAVVLPALADMFAATVTAGMTEREKRQAIARAVKDQKKRGEWITTVKPVIDQIGRAHV